VKIGEMVSFPNEYAGYEYQRGLLLAIRDNPSDVRELRFGKVGVPSYLMKGPRQIADILCKGKVFTCWKHNLRALKAEE